MKVPYDLTDFLRNGENKEMLFNPIQQAIVDGKSSLKGRTIFFSNKRDCMMINEYQAILVPSLSCNHEEADMKLVALVFAANLRQGDSWFGHYLAILTFWHCLFPTILEI